MLDVTRDEITEGSITRALLLLAAPLVVQNMVQVVQQIVDTFWVGRLGEDAVAAVGLNFPVMAFVFAAIMIPFVGTQVVVSQRVGGEDLVGARRAVFNGLVLALAIGVGLGALMYLLSSPIATLLGPNETVADYAAVYLSTVMLGLPLMAMSDTLEGGFVGWGDSRAALYVNVTAVVVNIVLDPLLILGWYGFPELGIEGAALATVAGYAAGFLLAVGMALRGRDGYRLTRDVAVLDRGDQRELLDVGAPITGQTLAKQSVRVVVIAIVSAAGGAAGLAAYTVGARIASVAFIPASGLSQAAQSVIGQNLGAEQPDRAARTTWVGAAVAVVGLSAVAAVQWFVPELLATLFVPDLSGEGLALTVDYLVILAYGYWAIGAMNLFLAGFNGARRTKVSMYASLLQYWAIRLPIAAGGVYLLDYGVHAVFWAVTLSNIAGAVGAGLYYAYTTSNGMLDRAAEQAAGATAD